MTNYDISILGKEATGQYTIRVDTWNGANRHWVYYFTQNEDGGYTPKASAISEYKSEEFNDEGLETAIEKLREADFEVAKQQKPK
jgi:hypothetical protein